MKAYACDVCKAIQIDDDDGLMVWDVEIDAAASFDVGTEDETVRQDLHDVCTPCAFAISGFIRELKHRRHRAPASAEAGTGKPQGRKPKTKTSD